MAAALCWGAASEAAPKRVAIADAAEDEAVGIRLRAELSAVGFSVVDVAAWSGEASPSAVAATMMDAGAIAAIRVRDDAADVWIVDTRTHAFVLRDVIRAGPSDDDATVAVRAVELVRAELEEIKRRSIARAPLEPVQADVQDSEPASTPSPFAVDLGAGVSASPGGMTVAPAFVIGATWWAFDHAGAGALVIGSPFPSQVEGDEGRAHVWSGLAGGGVVLSPTSPDAMWHVRLETGLAACWLHMEGSAQPGYVDGSETLVAGAMYVRPGLSLRLSRVVALQLAVVAAATVPRVVVSFAGREAASWGRPLIVASAGVELSP
jgi:hypothetical protein